MWKSTLYETSRLTLELRDVIAGGVDLWDFEYPSYYSGEAKKAFEKKVIEHFYFRQIGQETVGRFLHVFRAKVNEIMPYFIDMYKTVEIMNSLENPFDNVDVVETFDQESASQSNTGSQSESTGTQSSEHRFSNTPQGSIENLDNYLTEAARDSLNSSGTASTTSDGSASGTVSHRLHKKGNQGVNTFAHDIIEYRTSIIDVDMMVINELNCLFLGIY